MMTKDARGFELDRVQAENERLRAALENVRGVFERERMSNLCSLRDDDKTVTEIINAALHNEQSEVTK